MRYLSGTPFSSAVSNGKISQADWERAVGLPVKPRRAVGVKRCGACSELPADCQCFNEVIPGK